jgi:hypothetical protein
VSAPEPAGYRSVFSRDGTPEIMKAIVARELFGRDHAAYK